MNPRPPQDELAPPADAAEVEAICRHFTDAWKSGVRPRLEDYLAALPSGASAELRRRLVQIDIHFRQRHGEHPRPEDYEPPPGGRQEDLSASALATRSLAQVEVSAIATRSLVKSSVVAEQPAPAESKAVSHHLRCPNCHNPLPGAYKQGEAILCPACGGSCRIEPMGTATTLAELRVLGRFQLMDNVGQGAFGAVWRARDTELDRIVALKVPHASLLSAGDYLHRFQREARSAAQLRHPGIVRLYEVTVINGTPVLVSDFIEGVPLKEYLEVRRLTTREAAGLAAEVADALHYAHSMGLVHRDIKPANIMLERPALPGASARALGKPIIVDFGLALRDEAEIVMTLEGQIVGTPAYMSPEQAAGKAHTVDGRSDVYGLGVVLYELLCGELPFRGSKAMILNQVLTEEPRPPRRLNDHIPRDLETICLKALAKQPARRYATAGEMADDLRRYLRGEPIHARPIGRPERLLRWCRRNPLVASLSAAIAVVLLAGTITALHFAFKAAQGERDALAHAKRADEAAQAAEASRQREQQERVLSTHRYYAAEINLAQGDLLQGKTNLVQQRLQALRPQHAGDPDLRSFEWSFLDRNCHTELRTLLGHRGTVWSVACSPDGCHLASAGDDGTIRLWDLATGRKLQELPGHQGAVWCVAYSPDGQLLASVGADQTVRTWSLPSGQERWRLPTAQWRRTSSLAFSPDGQKLAVPMNDQTIQVLEARTGKKLWSLRTEPQRAWTCVAFSPDGKRLASIADRTVVLWDAQTGKPLFTIPTPQPLFTLTFSPDGRRLATAGMGSAVRVWDAATGRELMTLTGHNATVQGLAFSPDSRQLATASEDRTVKVWDLQTGTVLVDLLGQGAAVYSVAFDRQGWRLISGGADGTIKIWDAAFEQDYRALLGHLDTIFTVAFSPDGRLLASGGNDTTVRLWDVSSGLELRCLDGHVAGVFEVAFSPDGRLLASASGVHHINGSVFPGEIKIWDVLSGREVHTIADHPGEVRRVVFARDGRLASAEVDGTVRFWDVSTGQRLRTIQAHTKPVHDVVFSPDGRLFATCSDGSPGRGGEVRLWDVASGGELAQLGPVPSFMHHLAFSHDSRLLAGAGDDQAIHLWDVASRQELRVLRGHTRPVYRVVFSPDDHRLVSASLDHTFKIWDVLTGMELLNFPAHEVAVLGVAFSPDGRQLASSGFDRAIKVWDTRPRTPEANTQREALSLVTFLFGQGLSSGEVLRRVREDGSLSEAVRRSALALAEPYGQQRRRQAAHYRVLAEFVAGRPKEDILEQVRADRQIPEQVRRDAVRLVEQYPQNIGYVHWRGRVAVARDNLPAAQYRLALRQAKAACQAEPVNATYRTTLGMAQYRLGMVQQALQTLTRAERLSHSTPDPANLAVQAMCDFRLGQKEQARQQLDALEVTLRRLGTAKDPEAPRLLHEAEKLIGKATP